MTCGHDMVDACLRRLFFKLGHLVGRQPHFFITVPVLLTALFATGVQRLHYVYDPEYLFSPVSGLAKWEREVQELHFPTNYSAFKSSRMARAGRFGRLLAAPKENTSILATDLWNQLLYLDQIVYNVTVLKDGGERVGYEDLCARWNDYCFDNEILRLSELIPDIESGKLNITYPIYFDPYSFEAYTLPGFLGGVELSDLNTVQFVRSVSLSYFLDVSEPALLELGDAWEAGFIDDLKSKAAKYAPDLDVGMFVSNTPAWEMEQSRLSVTYTLIINILLMVGFSMLASTMSDAVKTKPWIGFGGLVSAALATVAGFGCCFYLGVEFISLNLAAPFLLLGIGIDDTFVMLSSWRRSNVNMDIPTRLAACYSDAAVSITVTSLTNFLGFMSGMLLTPFPCVRIFCAYTGVSVLFIYLWHIFIFGGLLALAGHAEGSNLHGALPCIKATPLSIAQKEKRGWLFKALMTGGQNPEDPHNPLDNKEHAGMRFFRDYFSLALTKSWVKVIVLIAFVFYVAGACFGLTTLKEGLEKRNTANYDSYSVRYYDMEDAFFKKYAFTINVVITGPDLDFSSPSVQERVEDVTRALEDSTYIDHKVTQSVFRDFLDYVERNREFGDTSINITTEANFVKALKEVYLGDSLSPQRLDIEVDESQTNLKSIRFLIQGVDIFNSYIEQNMLAELRDICHAHSTEDFSVSVFNPFFIYIDQYLVIRPQTIQCILVTAALMIVVALVLIPSVVCSLWVSFSIVSIELGVVGYMALWGVRLDGVALINLIMCIGFSVDFSAHICYHFISEVTDKRASSDERIRASLYALGVPILQGAGSTILGVVGLAFAPSYLFVTFFKMILLVITLGALHGLILLPVLLSILGPNACRSGKDAVDNAKNTAEHTSRSTKSSGFSTPTTVISHTVKTPDVPNYQGKHTKVNSEAKKKHGKRRRANKRGHHHQNHSNQGFDAPNNNFSDASSSTPPRPRPNLPMSDMSCSSADYSQTPESLGSRHHVTEPSPDYSGTVCVSGRLIRNNSGNVVLKQTTADDETSAVVLSSRKANYSVFINNGYSSDDSITRHEKRWQAARSRHQQGRKTRNER